MDWLKLFALLIAVASVQITADGPKKKIRIHLPQKVKHIHHHKKIYITNHPAPSQYAPAFLPGVPGVPVLKGGVALPSNVARPSIANIVPFNSVEYYNDEARPRLPPVSPAASKLLPLYRARGHYGPHPSEWDDQDYDLAPPPEPNDIYSSAPAYASPTAAAPPPPPSPIPKKIKIIKVNEVPRKKVVRKVKPKRPPRGRPQPQPVQPQPDEELPVSTFHEQFYSDLEEAGTIRKIRKPPRIEKIIDGDTEHIHTYSEEHIHKVVFGDEPKVTGVVGVDPVGSMSALTASHPLIPLKNAQALVAFPTGSLSDLSVMGSMGTPSHLEYSAYNPRDVTHDHLFHDHGEIPSGVDITKDGLRIPPKVSFNSHGVRVTGDSTKKYHGNKRLHNKPTKPTHDLSYYESIYSNYRPTKFPKPTVPTPHYEGSPDSNEYRTLPGFRFKDKRKTKPRSYGYSKNVPTFQLQQTNVPAPFSVSSTVVHEYDTKGYPGSAPAPAGFAKYRNPLVDFKDSYSNDFGFDTYASSSNIHTHTTEDKTDAGMDFQGKPGKKSVSTQNISFGGQDSQSYVDHLTAAASSNSETSLSDEMTALEGTDLEQSTDNNSPTPYTIKETSPAHPYYTAMALKALHGEQAEASNDNVHYVEAPTPSTDPTESPDATTTSQTFHIFQIQNSEAVSLPEFVQETRVGKRRKHKGDQRQRFASTAFKELLSGYQEITEPARPQIKYFRTTDSSSVRGNPKYGDKI